MGLRQTWLAVSTTKSTIMFSAAPSNIVLPPLAKGSKTYVRLDLGSQAGPEPSEFWLAISQEDGLA